jgi:hypothetical protein
MTSYTVDVGDGGVWLLGGSDKPKSKPRGFATLVLIGGGLFVEEKMIEEVAEVWDEDGRYSKAGL